MTAIALALLSIIPRSPTIEDRCDIAETNNFYDGDGRLIIQQVVWWNWNGDEQRFDVVDFRLTKTESVKPVRDWERGGYVSSWTEGGNLRTVRADTFWETWTQHDPEIEQRKIFPKEQRRGLTMPLKVR